MKSCNQEQLKVHKCQWGTMTVCFFFQAFLATMRNRVHNVWKWNTAVMLHWEGRMKTGPNWAVNRSQYVPLQTCLYQHFFFKRPYLGNETRFCKCVSGKTTPTDGAFTHSFMKVTSPNSFILFRPLSWKKALFRGVPVGPNWATLVQNMPLGPLSIMQKRTVSGKPNWSFAG